MAGPRTIELGWDATVAAAYEPYARDGTRPGRVIAVHRDTAIVGTDAGDRPTGVSGRFRYDALAASDFPTVGDWVVVAGGGLPAASGKAAPGVAAIGDGVVIEAVLPRRSAVVRSAADRTRRSSGLLSDEQVLAANVDVAFLVAGLDHDFNLRRLERYLAVAWSSGVQPVVVLNKADVAEDLDGRLVAVEAIAPGVPVVVLSALTGDHVADLAPHLGPARTAVVLGSSGVGKSTLVNALLGEARQAIGDVRAGDSRGRHTTTHRELFVLADGSLLIDTPGIRSLEVAGADAGVETAFDDIAEIAASCRFSDCRHEGEPGCAIAVALDEGRLSPERLASQRKLERELAYAERRGDPRAEAAERQRWKAISKSHRDTYSKSREDR